MKLPFVQTFILDQIGPNWPNEFGVTTVMCMWLLPKPFCKIRVLIKR